GELDMRPGEGNADDGHRKNDRGDEMAKRQPPARQHQPDQIADQPERPGADIGAAGEAVAAHRLLAERQQRIGRDIERGLRPGQADDGDAHDEAGAHPAKRHPQAAEDNPEDVQEYRDWRHGVSSKLERRASARSDLADPMTTGRTSKPNCGWAVIKTLALDPRRYPERQGSTPPESNTPLNLSTMRIVFENGRQ